MILFPCIGHDLVQWPCDWLSITYPNWVPEQSVCLEWGHIFLPTREGLKMGLPWPGAACEGYICVAGLYHCTENVKNKFIPISCMSFTFTVIGECLNRLSPRWIGPASSIFSSSLWFTMKWSSTEELFKSVWRWVRSTENVCHIEKSPDK